jgi:hypothetical protein
MDVALDRGRGAFAGFALSRGKKDARPAGGQLTDDFETDALVGAGDEDDGWLIAHGRIVRTEI